MRASILLVLLALGSSACGGTVVFSEDDGDAGGGGAGGSGAVGTSGPATAAATTGGAGQGGGASVTAGTTSGPTTTTGGGESDVLPSIVEVNIAADCMPEVGPDPLVGSVVVLYANLGSAAGSLESLRGEVIFSTSMEGWVFPIALEPTSSGLLGAGIGAEVEHTKVATDGDSSFVCQLCSMEGTVVLRWLDDRGAERTANQTFILGCAL